MPIVSAMASERKEKAPSAIPHLRVAGIGHESVVDGPGLRTVLFLQGCPRRCPGCHNPETQPMEGGRDMETSLLIEELSAGYGLISGITFSGGEPFLQAGPLAELAIALRDKGFNILIYSGYTLEELLELGGRDAAVAALMDAGDILIDGPYIEAKHDPTLAFRGSLNQRILDLPASIKSKRAVAYAALPPF